MKKQGRKRPLDKQKKIIERREREKKREREKGRGIEIESERKKIKRKRRFLLQFPVKYPERRSG